MKKTTLLHSEISYLIARLGHLDTIVIGDCGLPIPVEVPRIDLAVSRGIPSFSQVLEAVLSEMEVESYQLASEIRQENPALLDYISRKLDPLPYHFLPHEEFKKQMKGAVAVIRTGEASPYANIILRSGVKF